MKKSILLLGLILITLPAISQGIKYKKTTLKAIEAMNDATDWESSLLNVEKFEAIALAYPDQWIPCYYASMTLITRSLEDPGLTQVDEQLDRAKKLLNSAEELVPDESEIHLMKAMHYLGMITVDPATRGPMYFEDVSNALGKAKDLNPENPRAWYLDGLITLNMPAFMGGGPEAAKPIFLDAAEKFKAFQHEDPLWPAWGEELNQEELDKLIS